MMTRLALVFGLSIVYIECLYVPEEGKLSPMNVQVYNEGDNFGLSRLTRQNLDYTRSARVQPEQTVIVVPNQGIGTASRQPYAYGTTYGTSASRGPTVVVNVPDQNRVITDPYRRY